MAQLLINETTLTAIGNAIRGKEGTTELVPVNDMATRITNLPSGGIGSGQHYAFDDADKKWYEASFYAQGNFISTGFCPECGCKLSEYAHPNGEFTSNCPVCRTEIIYNSGVVTLKNPKPIGNEPTDEELTFTGDLQNKFFKNGWNWLIDRYGDRITTNNITSLSQTFNSSTMLEEIPFQLNVNNITNIDATFNGATALKVCPKIRGTITWNNSTTLRNTVGMCNHIRDWEDLFEPEMLDGYSTVIATSSSPRPCSFDGNYSLRRLPTWWYKLNLFTDSIVMPNNNYTLYYKQFSSCYTLDEAKNIPVWRSGGEAKNNMFIETFHYCYRLKDITFETNPDGSPIVVKWNNQTIDLTNYVGYTDGDGYILNYNSGITQDKMVYDKASYDALKNDPDWYSFAPYSSENRVAYSRYNHDSAVNTINSLPDASDYLSGVIGVNTITFKGASGELTDGGAINNLTEEEIAVATAKGWTVTLV